MHNFTKILDLHGICTITRTGGDSPLSVGDYAVERPFTKVDGSPFKLSEFLITFGIKVSDAKFDKAARKQSNNQVLVGSKTLLKHINPDMFHSPLPTRTVEEVTGQKGKWVTGKSGKGKMVYPAMTEEQQVWCQCAEWAHDSFGTLNGITVTISTVTGWVFTKKF